jgi:hypothetical protein
MIQVYCLEDVLSHSVLKIVCVLTWPKIDSASEKDYNFSRIDVEHFVDPALLINRA